MSENILDILNTQDLTDVSLRPPLIKNETNVLFNIVSVKQEPAKDGSNQNIVIYLKTAAEVPSATPGKTISAGWPMTYWISLKPVDKNGADRRDNILRDCAAFKLAATGTKAGGFLPLEQYIGRQITARVVTEKDANGVYADQNRIAKWVPPSGVKFE